MEPTRQERKSFWAACRGGDSEKVDSLLNSFPSLVNIKNLIGESPLHSAAFWGHSQVVALFLDKGADLHSKDKFGDTPLHNAALRGHPQVVALLLDKGADLNPKNKLGRTPLHSAAFNGHVQVVALLLDKGADLNVKNKGGNTALDSALFSGKKNVAILLIKHGAFEVSNINVDQYLSLVLQILKEECSLSDIIHNQQKDHTEHFLKYCLFMSAKNNKGEILKEICQLMKEHLPLEKIKEILDFKTKNGLFAKSLYNYVNENTDMASCMELIQLQHYIEHDKAKHDKPKHDKAKHNKTKHDKAKIGLNHLRNQNPRGPLTNWMLTTYSKLYPNKTSSIMAFSQVLFLVGILSYGLNVYDIYSDVQLYIEYSKYNISIFDEGVQRCQNSEIYSPEESHSTYKTASDITLTVLICSAIVYVLNVTIGRTPVEFIKKTIIHIVWTKAFNKLLTYPSLPFSHMYYSFKQLVSSQKTLHQEKMNRFRVLLNVIKIWEGLENNVQFIVSLWAARHFTPCLLNIGFQSVVIDAFIGLAGTLTFGYVKADFIQVLLGKLLLTIITSFLSLAMMKADKPGIQAQEKVVTALFLFIRYMFLTASRLCGLYSIIFLSNTLYKYQIYFGLHFLFTLIIVIIFERGFLNSMEDIFLGIKSLQLGNSIAATLEIMVYTFLRVLSSFFVLQSDPNKNEVTHTFVSQSLYQIICLTEDLTMVLIMHFYTELYPSEIIEKTNTNLLIWIVVVGWTGSVILQGIHYKLNHPWGKINGPRIENGRPVILTRLCGMKDPVDIWCCKAKEEVLEKDEEAAPESLESEMIIIKSKLQKLLPAEELIEDQEFMDIFVNKENFRRYIQPNALENEEQGQVIADNMEDDDKRIKNYQDLNISLEKTQRDMTQSIQVMQDKVDERNMLESRLYDLLPDEDSKRVLRRVLQLREELAANEQKEKQKNDITTEAVIHYEAESSSSKELTLKVTIYLQTF